MKRGEYVRPTRAIIHLGALRQNFLNLSSILSRNTKILSIVKANGYGHGISTIAKECARLGAVGAGVADISEALTLREEGYKKPILCLGASPPSALSIAAKENLTVTLHSADQLKSFTRFANRSRKPLRIHLKVETGMHRLGLDEETWSATAQRLKNCKGIIVEGVFTHLSESENKDRAFTKLQLQKFQSAVDLFQHHFGKRLIRHAANSGGILHHPHSHLDWVRPGIALYGYPHINLTRSSLRFVPVLTWKAPILQVKTIAAGDSVGYNRAFRAKKTMTIATIATGYGDGYLRRYSELGVGFRKKRIPILGIICMDLMMVDVTQFSNMQAGEEVTLLGPSAAGAPDAYEMARSLKTIPYEILTNIHARVAQEVSP